MGDQEKSEIQAGVKPSRSNSSTDSKHAAAATVKAEGAQRRRDPTDSKQQSQTIGAHFKDTSRVIWFPGSLGTFTVVLGPIFSQAADFWNRKWFLVIPSFLGSVGCLIISLSTSIYMVIAGFCLTGIAFGSQPLFHHGLFSRNRNFSISAFCTFCEGLAFGAINVYFTFHVLRLYEKDAFLVAVRYSLKYSIAAIFAVITGWICAATRRVRWIRFAGFSIFTVFFIGMASRNRGSDHAAWGCAALLGVAFGVTLTTLVVVAQISTPPELISIASGLNLSLRSVCGVVGLVVFLALFNDQMSHLLENIAEAVIPAGLAQGNIASFIKGLTGKHQTLIMSIPGITLRIIAAGTDAMLDTYVHSFRLVWIAAGCWAVLAAIGTYLPMYSEDIRANADLFDFLAAAFLIDKKDQFNMHIDHPLEKEEGLYSA